MAARFWVGGSGTWNDSSTTNWAATSGGASGASAPTTADTVTFDANSGTAAVVTVASTAACSNCTINKSDINVSLSGNVTFTGTLTLTTGTLTLGSSTLSTGLFVSSNSNARTIAFGTGNITLTGAGGNMWGCGNTANMTVTGTPMVNVTYAGATAVAIGPGTLAEGSAPSFNFSAGTYSLSFNSANTVGNMNFTGYKGAWDSTFSLTIYGNLTLDSGMTLINGGALNFAATSAKTITTNGATIDRAVTFNGVGGSWQLQDNFVMASGRAMTLTNGTFDASNKNVTVGIFVLGAGAKTLTLGSGTWTCLGDWSSNSNVTGLTVSAATATISMTSSSAKSFSGGGKTWPTLNQGGTGALTIFQSNTFTNITNTVQPATITLASAATQTVSRFGVSGTAGNLITLNASTPGNRATLLDSSGVNSVSYVSIKDVAATGAADWQAYTSNGNVDAGNNIGWEFVDPTPLLAVEYKLQLRSFTERRSF